MPVGSKMFIATPEIYEKFINGEPLEQIAPFWRVIDPNSNLAKKLSFDQNFLKHTTPKGKKMKK